MTTAVLCLPMLLPLGCQSGFRKQTHAAQRCLSSDPRCVSSGAEVKLDKNQTKALEAYKLEREKRRAGLDEDAQ
ncbi:MAG: hypothetical protein IAG10_20265 [Planctomycetaceae bacterium]|nr:hypothetical protein [Planctomycetaceae bacterium]